MPSLTLYSKYTSHKNQLSKIMKNSFALSGKFNRNNLLSQIKNFSLHRTTACMKLRLFTKAFTKITMQLLIHANIRRNS